MKHSTRLFSYTTETGYHFFTHTTKNTMPEYHDHDYIEIIAAIEGTMTTIINQKKYTLPPKTLVFLRPFDVHCFTENTTERHRDLCYTTDLFKETCDFLSKTLFESYMNASEPFIVTIGDDVMTKIETMAQRISANIDLRHSDSAPQIKILLVTLLDIYLSKNNQTNTTKGIPSIIEQLLFALEINSNISDKSLDEILDDFHYNKAYIRRIFKQHLGKDLSQFWLEKKLIRAAALLKTTPEQSIKEISITCGFNSYAYFNKKFIEKYGMTPLKFRKHT